jgi:hypothetical protein
LGAKNKIFSYLENNYNNLGVQQSEVLWIKTWYNVIAYALFGLCVMELVRFKLSLGYKNRIIRVDGEFDALLEEDNRKWKESLIESRQCRSEKYKELRSHYKAKYSKLESIEDNF